jgi:preprotein translocase subunit SecE
VADVAKQGFGERISGFFRSMPEFVRQVQAEARKIVWPSRKETVMTAVMVVIMTVLLGIFFFGVDTAFNGLVHWLLSLAVKA